MDASRTKHLWRSSEVRSALGKEAWCLFVFVVIYVGTVAVSRYLREKPAFEGFWSAAIGAVAVILIWLVSAVRTLRAVSRENDAPPLRAAALREAGTRRPGVSRLLGPPTAR